jgi:hypothetical protein
MAARYEALCQQAHAWQPFGAAERNNVNKIFAGSEDVTSQKHSRCSCASRNRVCIRTVRRLTDKQQPPCARKRQTCSAALIVEMTHEQQRASAPHLRRFLAEQMRV